MSYEISTFLPYLLKRQTKYFVGWLFILFCLGATSLIAQDTEIQSGDVQENGTRVYIDCESCDYNHIRREITFVSYVRDPNLADVHVFITDESTGGGRQYEFTFIDQRESNDTEYTFTHTVDRNASSDEIRESLNGVLEMGLAPFVMQMTDPSLFSLIYNGTEEEQGAGDELDDPWNYWVFEIYAGGLQLDLESNQKEFDSRWGFYADHVTENWKIRLRPYFNYEFVEIDRDEEEDPVTSRLHRHGLDSYLIKSLSDHWSAGLFADYITRNDRNLHHRVRLRPGLEYNIFPYRVATRKAITFRYQIGYAYADYYEETIFEKSREHLMNHELSASIHIEQPWGEMEGGLEGAHYFHDFAYRRAEFFGNISVRLTEGLSMSFDSRFEMIQDQLSLPIGDTSLEDVLLEQRELATDFSFSGAISLTYTFGSDFANVVNTRF